MAALLDRPARRWLADRVETLFGPDPGLVRLHTAARAIAAVILTVGIAVLLFGGSKQMAPAFAAAFLICIFGNVAVRDDGDRAKIVSLVLLAVTITVAMGVAGALSGNPRLADVVVFLVCVGASLARIAGPRGMALGLISFMGSFMGDFLKVAPAMLPKVLVTALIGAAAVSLLRLWLMRDDATELLQRVRYHLDRRIGRIVRAVRDLVAGADGHNPPDMTERNEHRVQRELARLNEAFLVAQNELNDIEELPDNRSHLSWDRFFALELAAERLIRVAAHYGGQAQRDLACQKLDELNAALVGGRPLPKREADPQGPLLRAIDALIAALDRDDPASRDAAPVETAPLD
ncbi:MAG: hypothetical protein ACTHMG_08230 [Sphingomonas sp.]